MDQKSEVAGCGEEDRSPDPRPLEGPVAVADLARLGKAVGHPARAKILSELAGSESCFYGDLAAELGLAKSTVSEHLRILARAGLIRGEIDGPRRCYCAQRRELRRLRSLVEHLLETRRVEAGS